MTDYKEKFEKMRIAGNLASRTLDMLTEYIKPGISTEKIDQLGFEFIKDNNGYSAPQFYRGFKKSLCTSLNHVVCHGIPSDRVLEDGDIINVDVTAIVNEYYGDTSRMYMIGSPSIKAKNLVDATYNSMMKAIKILKPGIKLGDIGNEIQTFVEEKGYSVVRDFCGHGIPSDRILNDGDAVNVDVTAIVNDYYGDTSRMFTIGEVSIKAKNLIDSTYESMMSGIKILKPGVKLGDIGFEIQSYVEEKGYSVVRDFCGHGISNTFQFFSRISINHYL